MYSQEELITKVLNGDQFSILTNSKLGYCSDRGLIVENENGSSYTANYQELQTVRGYIK